jgi:hypothetical protein
LPKSRPIHGSDFTVLYGGTFTLIQT